MYKLVKNTFWKDIVRISDGVVIPVNLGNEDYQAYLKWLDEGNTPLPADE